MGFFDGIFNTLANVFMHEDDVNLAKNQYKTSLAENIRQYNTSLNEQQRQYDTSLAFNKTQANLQQQNWEKNFAQQQYNYENASQIRAADMQKAGLNPLMLVGGAEGSTPVSLGSSVSAPGASGAPGATSVSGRGVAPFNSQLSLGIIDKYLEMKEREKDRENAKEIAVINANAQKYSADSSSGASKYGSDINYSIAALADDTRREELAETKREYDWDLEKSISQFRESILSQEKMQLIHEDREDSRKLAEVTSNNYRTALQAYESALEHNTDFALAIAKFKMEWYKFQTEKDFKQKEIDLESTRMALDNATKIFQSISNLAGDVAKGFIIGRLK